MLTRVLVLLLLAVVIALCVHGLVASARGNRRHLIRLRASLAAQPGVTDPGARAFVRIVVPVYLLCLWFCAWTAVVIAAGPPDRAPFGLVAVLVAIGGVPVLAVLVLVVRFTGHPAVLVPRPVRGASETEVQAWFGAEREVARLPVRRVHRLFGELAPGWSADEVATVALLLRHREPALALEAMSEILADRGSVPPEWVRAELADLATTFGVAVHDMRVSGVAGGTETV